MINRTSFNKKVFYPSALVTAPVLEECIMMYQDSMQVLAALSLHLSTLTSIVMIDYLDHASVINGAVIKTQSGLSQNQFYIKGILQFSVDVGMSPETLFKFVNGSDVQTSILPLILYFEPNCLIITATDKLYTVMLVAKQATNIALFTLVFDAERTPVFP
jgi:hypothetical protein